MITKYEQYYNKIRELLEVLKEENGYPNLSVAFNHWYLQSMHNLSEQEIGETIVDGGDDYGIDSIICDEENGKLTVFQFKFPNSVNNLNSEISQSDILKTLQGFEILRGNKDISGSNSKFESFKQQLSDMFIREFELVFVAFNSGIVQNKDILEATKESFKKETGSRMIVTNVDKEDLSNLFEKLTRTMSIEAVIPYKMCQQAYSTKGVNSYIGVVDAVDLVGALKDKMLFIFDENIRLLEEKSSVNDQIRLTASNSSSSNMFYFYNNGIVFICDKACNSPNSLKISLKGASIVNGCQTVNSLYSVYKQGKLKKDVSLLFRVIEISEYDERSRITSYLNSQNSIKGSYFIANNSIIRDLQDDLLEQGYYLERQKNERKYKSNFGKNIDNSLISIELEDMIQYYTGYYINELSAAAKRGKGVLFESNNINEILSEITADKVIESFEMYHDISKVITKYRKFRRNPDNTEFSEYIGLSQDQLCYRIDEFLFMNTADILLLNVSRNLKQHWEQQDLDYNNKDLIINSIGIVRETLHDHLLESSPASLTKKSEIFEEVRDSIPVWERI